MENEIITLILNRDKNLLNVFCSENIKFYMEFLRNKFTGKLYKKTDAIIVFKSVIDDIFYNEYSKNYKGIDLPDYMWYLRDILFSHTKYLDENKQNNDLKTEKSKQKLLDVKKCIQIITDDFEQKFRENIKL